MSLIHSRQIKSLDAIKVITTADQQFVSEAEKQKWDSKLEQNDLLYKGAFETLDLLQNIIDPVDGCLVFVKETQKFYLYDLDNDSWVELDKGTLYSYLKSVSIPIIENNQSVFLTGIYNDQTRGLYTSHKDILLIINGIVQKPNVDYKCEFNEFKELVITYLDNNIELLKTDHLYIYFNNLVSQNSPTLATKANIKAKDIYWDDILEKPAIYTADEIDAKMVDVANLKSTVSDITDDVESVINAIGTGLLQTTSTNVIDAINELLVSVNNMNSKLTNIEGRLKNLSFEHLTESEYDALDKKDVNTIYFLK